MTHTRKTALLCAGLCTLMLSNPVALADASSGRTPTKMRDRYHVTIEKRRCNEPDPKYANTNLRRFRSFAQFNMSASSQFSREGLVRAVRNIRAIKPGAKIMVVDLREESHFFDAMGIPHHLKGEFNWANQGKSARTIAREERRFAEGGFTEKSLIESVGYAKGGLSYARVPWTDHAPPTNAQVDRLIKIFRHAQKNGIWLHFHCKAGKGRTTTALVLNQMFVEAHQGLKRTSFSQMLAHHLERGGSDLAVKPVPQEQRSEAGYKDNIKVAKLKVLESFYAWSQTPDFINATKGGTLSSLWNHAWRNHAKTLSFDIRPLK